MKKILVPTDFSKNALKAVTYASEIAQKSGASIFLLHVIEPDINMVKMGGDSYRDEKVKENLGQLNLYQKSVTDIYPGIKVEVRLAWGATIDSILDFAEEEEIDLIVMGTTGASGLKEFFMGSVTAGTIGKTNIPVLTVPVSYEIEEPDAILLATNQFEKNINILEKIISISKLFSMVIHVVVFKDIDGEKYADLIYNEEQLNDYLHFLRETFPDIIFKGEILEGTDFEITIDRYSNKNEVDIIAMITYPKNFLERLLKKSVTKKMAFHSTIPLLAIPVKE